MKKNEFSKVCERGLSFYISKDLDRLGIVRHFISTRSVQVSLKREMNLGIYNGDNPSEAQLNLKAFLRASGMNDMKIVYMRQCHGDNIAAVDYDNWQSMIGCEADALVTNCTGISIGVFTADCASIILVDKDKRAVAAIHAGWRGTVSGIAGKTVRRMHDMYLSDPGDIFAVIGPSIGSCCFEVSEEVAFKFRHHEIIDGRYYADIKAEIFDQLTAEGLLEENILNSNICTYCRSDEFFSYRKEKGKTGRMGTFVELI